MKKLLIVIFSLLFCLPAFSQREGENYKLGDFRKSAIRGRTVIVGNSWTLRKLSTNASFNLYYGGTAIYSFTTTGGLTLTAGLTATTGTFSGAVTIGGTLVVSDDVTTSSATPAYQFKDTDCTDADVNAYVVAAATTTTTGAEDIDVTFYQQVAGTGTAFITADADGNITLGTAAQPVAVTGNFYGTGTNSSFIGTGGSANNAALKVATASGTPQLILDDVDATDAQEPMWFMQSANDATNGVLYIGYGDRSDAITMTGKTDMIIVTPTDFTLGITEQLGIIPIYSGAVYSGSNGVEGRLDLFSEQGGTDYTASIYPNTAMTSAASYYFPADEPGSTLPITMSSGGVMAYNDQGLTTTSDVTFNNVTADMYVSTTVTISTSSDAVDVVGKSILLVNTNSGNITIGGFVNGVTGQLLYVLPIDDSNNIILEDDEGTGNQDIKCNTGADITITAEGGSILVFDGTYWRNVSAAL